MISRIGRNTALSSLVAGVALCAAASTAGAASISAGSVRVGPDRAGAVQVGFNLVPGTDAVAGTQYDVAFDVPTPFVSKGKVCLKSRGTCTTDADCPLACAGVPPAQCGDPTLHEPCAAQPDCALTTSVAAMAGYFSFVKTPGCLAEADCGCTVGTDCTAIRAIVFDGTPDIIPSGAANVRCNIKISSQNPPAGGYGVQHDLTVSASTFSDKDGVKLTAGTNSNGKVVIGCLGNSSNTGELTAIEASQAVSAYLLGDVTVNPSVDGNFNGEVEAIEVSLAISNYLSGACQ